MYSALNFSPKDDFFDYIGNYKKRGEDLYQNQKNEVEYCLYNYINNRIDGTALKNIWFDSSRKYDIFISHSHKDLDNIKIFAGWISNTFGLKVFIDSCSWGYSDDLLRSLDNLYCKLESGKSNVYEYYSHTLATKHVDIMLSTALTEMINNCECIIFVNTPNSILLSEELKKEHKNRTESAWIYHELTMTTMLPRKRHKREITTNESFGGLIKDSFHIDYDISGPLERLQNITEKELYQWEEQWKIKKVLKNHPLDVLYKIIKL